MGCRVLGAEGGRRGKEVILSLIIDFILKTFFSCFSPNNRFYFYTFLFNSIGFNYKTSFFQSHFSFFHNAVYPSGLFFLEDN